MHYKTIQLKNNVESHELIPHRLHEMKDFYKDETAYIVTCGPSLNDIPPLTLKDKLKDKLVIANKQAYIILEEVTDFHILNIINYQPYRYKTEDTIVIWEVFEQYHPQLILEQKWPCHLMLPVTGNHIPNPQRMDESQAGKLNFEDCTLDKTIHRQFGPGMMYEIIFHLAVYLGVKKIVVIGWDIGDLSQYSGDNPNEEIFHDHFYSDENNLYGDITKAKCGMTYRETQVVINSTKSLKDWLNSKGIELELISDKSSAHESIKRVKL